MEINFAGKRALVTGAGKGIGRALAKALWTAGATTYGFSRTQSDLGLINMEINFAGKRALVTGAGKGIGRALAKALWTAGAMTYAVGRTQSDLDTLKAECPGMHMVCVDLTKWLEAQAAVEAMGDIDLLVNNAGIFNMGSLLEATEAEYEKIFSINVAAVLSVSQVVAKSMMKNKSGAIVNISSRLSSVGTSPILYGASKGAVDQITRCMAVELGPHNIRVNAVKPCLVPDTAMGAWIVDKIGPDGLTACEQETPMKRVPLTKDVVNAVLYLLSDKADMINGAFLPVEGGASCT